METVLRALERRFKHSKGTIQNSVLLLMIYGFEEFISTQLFRWDEFLYKHKVLQPLLDHSSIKQKSDFSRLKLQGGTFNSGVWDRDTVTCYWCKICSFLPLYFKSVHLFSNEAFHKNVLKWKNTIFWKNKSCKWKLALAGTFIVV